MTTWNLPVVLFMLTLPGLCSSRAGGRLLLSVEACGASGDGRTINTQQIQRAVDSAHTHGGGTVVMAHGVYLTGELFLRSGVELHIAEGATVLGSADPYRYALSGRPALLCAENAKDVAITGGGTIDGQGLELALAIDSLVTVGALKDPAYNAYRHRPSEDLRPRLIDLVHCTGVRVRSVTLSNAAGWVQSYTNCSDVVLDSLTVRSRAFWNNDGIDIVDSRRVTIAHCSIDAADDGICLKSRTPDACCDSVTITDCTVRSSASAVKCGTDSWGGFRNITIRDITVLDTYRSAVAIECVDGGVVENISVDGVTARNTGNAFFIRLGHRRADAPPGVIRHVRLRDISVEVPFGRPDTAYDLRGPDLAFFHNTFPASIAGIPGHPVTDVAIANCSISYPGRGTKGMAYVPLWDLGRVPEAEGDYPEFSMFGELPAWGVYFRHARGVHIASLALEGRDPDYRPALVVDDVANFTLLESAIHMPGPQASMVLRDVSHALVSGLRLNGQSAPPSVRRGSCEDIRE